MTTSIQSPIMAAPEEFAAQEANRVKLARLWDELEGLGAVSNARSRPRQNLVLNR